MKVLISEEMRSRAVTESKKRDLYIKHHFEVSHLSSAERDQIGFLGEFACCELFNIDWRSNIRENYLSIDDFDFIHKDMKIDVKSETVPLKYANNIINSSIGDNNLYGRRLINKGQFNLLKKYDIILFGLFIREHPEYWYPIGYINTSIVLDNYPPTYVRPDGGKYPFPASPVPTSILKPITDLL